MDNPAKPIVLDQPRVIVTKHPFLAHHLHTEEEREHSISLGAGHEIHTVDVGGMDGHIHSAHCKCGPTMNGTDMRIWHHKVLHDPASS